MNLKNELVSVKDLKEAYNQALNKMFVLEFILESDKFTDIEKSNAVAEYDSFMSKHSYEINLIFN